MSRVSSFTGAGRSNKNGLSSVVDHRTPIGCPSVDDDAVWAQDRVIGAAAHVGGRSNDVSAHCDNVEQNSPPRERIFVSLKRVLLVPYVRGCVEMTPLTWNQGSQ